MDASTFQISFSGRLVDGISEEQAKENLHTQLKINSKTVESMFSGKSMILRKNLDPVQAKNYAELFKKAGIIVEIKPPLPKTAGELSLEPKPPEPKPPEPETLKDIEATDESQDQNPYELQDSQKLSNAVEDVFCRQCGGKIHHSDQACRHCGAKQTVGAPRSKVVAGLLALFCGGLGIHRFYLGQWWGIIYWFIWPLSSVISLVETLVFFCTSEQNWQTKYGNVKPISAIILIIVCIPILIAIIGILAAIAIPQYHDYTVRAKVFESIKVVDKHKEHITDFIIRTNFVPNSNLDAGLPEIIEVPNLSNLAIEPGGKLVATFDETTLEISGKTIVWIPTYNGSQVTWDCSGGSLHTRHRPSNCRSGEYATEQTKDKTKVVVAHDNLTEVTVPKNWAVLDLHEEATLEVGNEFSEAYLICLPDFKFELEGFDLKQFANLLINSHTKSNPDSTVEFIEERSVNGLPALHYKVKSRVDSLEIIYRFSFIEGEDKFYQILAWSLASRYSGNSDKLESAIESFKERSLKL